VVFIVVQISHELETGNSMGTLDSATQCLENGIIGNWELAEKPVDDKPT
jgi:hypothetical protein